MAKVKVVNGKLVASEYQEQCALFDQASHYPELKTLFAVPNGVRTSIGQAVKLKKSGLKKGVPDVVFPCARGGYHGLYIEMKVGKNKPHDEQLQWHQWLREEGYYVTVCYSAAEAMKVLIEYCLGQIRRTNNEVH